MNAQQQRDSLLSEKTTVSQYRAMEQSKDSDAIAGFIYQRFHERYIRPFDVDPTKKNGFIMMASACLLIEALESFWNGWPRSKNYGSAFCQFFDRNSRFSSLHGQSQEFYKHIRCGIMHQGETTGGWHIRRDQRTLFDKATKTIDATIFLHEMEGSLSDYCGVLRAAAWDSERWKNLRKKMKDVCDNTQASKV